MGVFIFLFIALALIILIAKDIERENKKRLFQAISGFLLLWLIQGLRHETIGTDSYGTYRPFFESLYVTFESIFDLKDSYANFETGYILFNKVFKYFISTDTQFFVLFVSFLSIAPISYIIYRYSSNIIVSYYIFAGFIVYHFGFAGMRQAIAISLCALSFHFIVQRKPFIFASIVILASTFHTSAIIFLSTYFLYNFLEVTPKKYLIGIIIAFVLSFSLKSIAEVIIGFLFGGEKYMGAIQGDVAPSYNLLLLYIILLACTFFTQDLLASRLRSIILLAVCFQMLGLISTHATRLAYYYMVFFCIALPRTISFCNKQINIQFWNLIVVLFMVSFFIYGNSSGYLDVIPYKFFWE